MLHVVPAGILSFPSGFTIENAIWFDGTGGADVLQRTPFVAGTSNKKFVLAGWMKCLTDIPENYTLVGNTGAADNTVLIWGNDTGSWRLRWTNAIATVFQTGDLSRDPTAWLHWCLAVDTTQSTDTNRVKFYINGTEVNDYGSTNYPAQDATTLWNSTTTQEIHQAGGPPMILAQLVNLDGQSIVGGDLAITDLVGSDSKGVPIPVDVSGLTYGTNGWLLNFDQSGLLGASSNSSTNPTVSFLGSNVQGSGSTHTVSDATLGAAASNRSIVIAAGGARSNAGTRTATYTVGGSAATEIVRSFSGKPNCLYFFIIDVPTGTEADIVVSYSGGNNNMDASGIAWWRVLDAGSPISISTANADGWSSLPITNMGQSGDVTLYGLFDSGNVTAFNWSDATERADHSNITGSSTTFLSFTAADYFYTSGESHTETVSTASGSGNETSFAAITLSNNNSFETNSLSAANQVTDTCTDNANNNIGNYPTWSPVDKDSNVTLSEGNTVAEQDSTGAFKSVLATQVVPSTGKWVWEIKQSGGSPFAGYATTGVASTNVSRSIGRSGAGAITFDYQTSSNKIRKFGGGATESDYATGVSMAGGEAFQFAIDSDAEELKLFVNNTQEGSTLDISSLTKPYKIISQLYSGGTVDHTLVANSADFENNVPTGYKTINTANLPAPTVTDPSAFFQNVLYDGTGSTQSITLGGNSNMQPDFVWIKRRNVSETIHNLFDSVRGATKHLNTSSNTAQVTTADTLTSFDSDGFSLGADASGFGVNVSTGGSKYVAWCWKAGGSGSSNSDGNIASTVSVASHNGFSIVKYDPGSGGSAGDTVGHGMGKAPNVIISKPLENVGDTNWQYGTDAIGWTRSLFLNTAGAQATASNYWNNTAPTSTVFSLGSDRDNDTEYIAYCFAKTPGLIGIGSYTGNNDADGTYVVVDDGAFGFRPAWLLMKNINDTENWVLMDSARSPFNAVDGYLSPNTNAQDTSATGLPLDFTANGFKQRNNSNMTNEDTIIYLAFAENPFGGSGVAQAKAR